MMRTGSGRPAALLRIGLLGTLALGGLAGCGARQAPPVIVDTEISTDPASPTTSASPTRPAPQTSVPGPGGPDTAASPSGEAESEPETEEQLARSREMHNNGVVTIRLSTSCARPGEAVTVVLQAPPSAAVSVIAQFPDGRSHGQSTVGRADESGRFEWVLTVPPTSPPGTATVLAGSSGPGGTSEGSGSADARVGVDQDGVCA